MTMVTTSEVLSPDEIRRFTQRSNARGLLAVARTWVLIAALLGFAALVPAWWSVLLVVVLLGGQQLALAVLMHEAAHRTLLTNRRANDAIGRWLCAAPIWLQLDRYRAHHLRHHKHTGTEADPDLGLVTPFPASRRSLLRKFARDVSGLAGLRRIVAQLAMDAGVLTYTASTNAHLTPADQRTPSRMARGLLRHTGPTVLTNLALAACLFSLGAGWAYGLWVAAWLTSYSVFVRIRGIAEHAGTTLGTDRLRNTRTTYANLLARMTVAPLNVNYHLEHHLVMAAPHYQLPALHRHLRERGVLDQAPVASGYTAVFHQVSAPA